MGLGKDGLVGFCASSQFSLYVYIYIDITVSVLFFFPKVRQTSETCGGLIHSGPHLLAHNKGYSSGSDFERSSGHILGGGGSWIRAQVTFRWGKGEEQKLTRQSKGLLHAQGSSFTVFS